MYELNYSTETFLDLIYSRSNSDECKKSYRTGITRFQDFIRTKFTGTVEEFITQIKTDNTDVNLILRDFVLYLNKQGYKPRSVSAYVSSTKKYIRYCGIRIYNEDFKQAVVMPRKMKVQETPLTKDLLLRLIRNSSPKLQAAILFAISSGMRISEIVQLTLDDIDFSSNPTKIRIRAETTKTRAERETFITAEATNALKDYLRRNHGWEAEQPNSHLAGKFIFGRAMMRSHKLRKTITQSGLLASKSLLQKTLDYAVAKIPDLSMKNKSGIKVIHFHAFRKFFRTTVGNICGRDFAEALIGHGFYMDTYYVLSEEQKRELYLKAEPYLTISDFKAVENNIKNITERCTMLEQEVSTLKQYIKSNKIEVLTT